MYRYSKMKEGRGKVTLKKFKKEIGKVMRIRRKILTLALASAMALNLVPSNVNTVSANGLVVEELDDDVVDVKIEPETQAKKTTEKVKNVVIEPQVEEPATTEEPFYQKGGVTEATESAVSEATEDGSTEQVATDDSTSEDVGDEDFLKVEEIPNLDIEEVNDSIIEMLLIQRGAKDGDRPTIQLESGQGDSSVWYINDNGKKRYVFCLDHGLHMNGGYLSTVQSGKGGMSGQKLFQIGVALDYFNAKKDYHTAQHVIWGWTSTDKEAKLITYANHLWNVAVENGGKSSGSTTYSKLLKPINSTSSSAALATVGTPNNVNLGTVSKSGKKLSLTKALAGTSWKYFCTGGAVQNAKFEVVHVYDCNGNGVGTKYASINSDGSISFNEIPIKKGVGDSIKHAYTVVVSLHNANYRGATNLQWCNVGTGYQRMLIETDHQNAAYFAINVYGKIKSESKNEDAKVSINKEDEFGNPVAGCTFGLFKQNEDNLEVGNEETGKKGAATFEIKESGVYYLKELDVPDGMEINSKTYFFTAKKVTEDNVEKILITKAGGSEISATASYSFTCVNKYASGGLKVLKKGKVLTGYNGSDFTYETRNLEGVEFKVYAEDNITIGGQKIFTAGDEVTNGTKWGKNHKVTFSGSKTDTNGVITVSDLPVGNYKIIETSALPGFTTKSNEAHIVTVTENAVVEVNGADGILNEQATCSFNALKTDTDTQEAVIGAQFTLYASINNTNYDGQPLFNSSGSAVISRDLTTGAEQTEDGWVAIATATTDSTGLATFSDFPAGDYLVVETEAPVGYHLAEESYKFTHDAAQELPDNGFSYNYHFKDTKTRKIFITKEAEKLLRFTQEKGFEYETVDMEGVVFGVYANGDIVNSLGNVVYTKDQLIQEVTTGADGTATVTDVIFAGNYYAKELKTADDSQYVLDDKKYEFTVDGSTMNKDLTEDPIMNKLMKGSLKVIKTDGENEVLLEGVEFEVTNADKQVIGTYTTDANGEFTVKDLPIGTYYVKETKAKTGYKTLSDTVAVSIVKGNLDQVVNITNDRMKGSVKVIKTDGETKMTLEGVEFELRDANNDVIGTYTTDENGEIYVDNLELGTYFVQETKSLEGYVLNEETQEVTLSPEQLNALVEVENDQMKGSIKVIKTDGDTEVTLEGVEFELTYPDGKVEMFTTDENGEIYVDNLSVGEYTLVETNTLEGYVLDDTEYTIDLTFADLDQIKELVNYTEDSPSITLGSIQIVKIDGDTKKPLEGVKFELTDEDGEVIGKYTTDKNGEIMIKKLELGTYTVTETNTLKDYKLLEEPVEIVLTEEEADKYLEIKNYKNEASSTSIRTNTPKTGDTLPVLPIVIVCSLAAILGILLIFKGATKRR